MSTLILFIGCCNLLPPFLPSFLRSEFRVSSSRQHEVISERGKQRNASVTYVDHYLAASFYLFPLYGLAESCGLIRIRLSPQAEQWPEGGRERRSREKKEKGKEEGNRRERV